MTGRKVFYMCDLLKEINFSDEDLRVLKESIIQEYDIEFVQDFRIFLLHLLKAVNDELAYRTSQRFDEHLNEAVDVHIS